VAVKPPSTCHALALSAAESNGSFQAGAIYSLINHGNSLDFEWDVVTGISFGAMNAAIVGAFPKGQNVQMSEYLTNTWGKMNN